MIKNAVIVFAKYPGPGVKTRLAKTTGSKFASEFYKLCAEHTFGELRKLPVNTTRVYLFYSDKEDEAKIIRWVNSDFIYCPQKGSDLGERMFNAFSGVFKEGAEKVLIIGTDLPDISAERIQDAFDKMEGADVVIGPSTDGGYYLLGLRQPVRELFENIGWSSNSVYSSSIEKIKATNLTFNLLPAMTDIDNEEELNLWLNDNSTGSTNKLRAEIKSLYSS